MIFQKYIEQINCVPLVVLRNSPYGYIGIVYFIRMHSTRARLPIYSTDRGLKIISSLLCTTCDTFNCPVIVYTECNEVSHRHELVLITPNIMFVWRFVFDGIGCSGRPARVAKLFWPTWNRINSSYLCYIIQNYIYEYVFGSEWSMNACICVYYKTFLLSS